MRILTLFILITTTSTIFAHNTEGHITILDNQGKHRVTLVRLYDINNSVFPIKAAYSYDRNCCGWPDNANFAFDTASDWDSNAQWTDPNHLLPGIYRLRIDDKYVELTITQQYCGDFFLKFQYGEFSVINIMSPQYVQVSETRFWDVPITFEQKASNGIEDVGKVGVWINGGYEYYDAPHTFNLISNKIYYFHADTNIYNNEKYHKWDYISDVVNFHEEPVGEEPFTIRSNFLSFSTSIVIKNNLENSGISFGELKYADPWVTEEITEYGKRNKGNSATLLPIPSFFNPNPNGNILEKWYKGVFLNQRFDIPNNPYYSVKAEAIQDIQLPQTGRTHRLYFQGWSANPTNSAEFQNANALETGVVFCEASFGKDANAVVQANLKGTQLSNNPNAYANNS